MAAARVGVHQPGIGGDNAVSIRIGTLPKARSNRSFKVIEAIAWGMSSPCESCRPNPAS